MNKRLLLIVNPCAGQRKIRSRLTEVIEIFNRSCYTVITHITAGFEDATQAVLRYADEVELVVCCGGDGTFNETISGILKCGKNLPVGYIPAGSTNDFASNLHLSADILQAARDIMDGETLPLDVGCFGERYFSYIASFGIFTKTSYSTPQSLKNTLGHAAYILNGIQELSQLKSHSLRIELPDGKTIEDKFIFGAISNSISVGGIMKLSQEHVDLSDGKLELLLIREPKDLRELADCVRAIQKQTYDSEIITLLSTPSAQIYAPEDMDWTLDGEKANGQTCVEVHCLHNAITVHTAKL